MKTTDGFVVEISSDLDYEDMVANVLYEEETVAIISQEKGLDNLEIEILPSIEGKHWKFFLENFLKALQLSKKRLIEMQKLPDE